MAVDLDTIGIDPGAPEYQPMLEQLQCNILKPHGRDFSTHIFLQFMGEIPDVKAWLRSITEHYVISALRQLEESRAFTADGTPGGLIGSLFLSAEGYRYLELDVDSFPEEGRTFLGGMKMHGANIIESLIHTNNRDPDPAQWEQGYQSTIHAMLLLAHDDKAAVQEAVVAVEETLVGIASVVVVEHGNVLRNAQPQAAGKAEPPRKGQPIEHFGYLDGRSNPLFLKPDIVKEQAGGGVDAWDPSASLRQVLVPDPMADTEDCFGSYLVFRKLEQNVAAFRLAIESLASQLDISPDLAGAFAFGRFKDGTPVTNQGEVGLGGINNFNYADTDRQGHKCPFHSHARKVNPRGTTPFTSLESERSRRIARRGIPYGLPNEQKPPRAGVGLLFMCYQSDIHHQWEFMQRTWADNPNFPRNLILPDTGDDPIIGQDSDSNGAQKWPTAWNSTDTRRADFGGYVTLKGGEFFFAPSLRFLTTL